ncbi:MAG: hypothetical protein EBZ77_15035, partial [Chitinophagia bacterium]|nr:hypothetical protein [Chitinophagia bacterium]
KMAPIPGTTYALLKGEAFGKPYNLNTTEGRINIASNLAEPLYLNSLREILADKSISNADKAFILAVGLFGYDTNEAIKPKDEGRKRTTGGTRGRDPRTKDKSTSDSTKNFFGLLPPVKD